MWAATTSRRSAPERISETTFATLKRKFPPNQLDMSDIASSGVVRQYLDLPEVRELLGVHPNRPNFSSCDRTVSANFGASLDRTGQTWLYVGGLLERGIRTLVYVGTQDWICECSETLNLCRSPSLE